LLNSPGPLPLAHSVKKPSAEIPDHELSPLALKRRQERRLRESGTSQYSQSPSLDKEESSQSDNEESETATPSIDTAELEEEEDASPTVQEPEFTGPEPISETIFDDIDVVQYRPIVNGHDSDSVEVSESPIYRLNPNLIDSLVGGDYSEYTSLSSSISNSTSPTALTIVNTAELALSRHRDHIIPQRKRAVKIVKTLVEGNLVQATKES